MRFKKNDVITIDETKEIKVKEFLGDGGQGEVYLVEYEGGSYALKVYLKPRNRAKGLYRGGVKKGDKSNCRNRF